MTKFLDGPAGGQTLLLQRAPVFLRVVRERDTGGWDALDKLEDHPRPSEDVFVYRRTANPGVCHLNFGRCRGGFYAVAEYVLHSEQPDDVTLRDTPRWRAWTTAQLHPGQ